MRSTPESLTTALLQPSSEPTSLDEESTATAAAASQAPYTRHVLSSRTVPPPPDVGLSLDEWRTFWTMKLVPILESVEWYDSLLLIIVLLGTVSWFVGIAIYLAVAMKTGVPSVNHVVGATIVLLVVTSVVVSVWYGRVRSFQQTAIQTVCANELKRHGFAVSCNYESWGHGIPSYGFCLYILPIRHEQRHDKSEREDGLELPTPGPSDGRIRNGYLCIEIYNTGRTWTPISLPDLASFDVLPAEFRSIDGAWARFWTTLQIEYQQILFFHRLRFTLSTIAILSMVASQVVPLSSVPNVLVHAVAFVLGTPTTIVILWNFERKRRRHNVIRKHAAGLAQLGYLLEHRRVLVPTQWFGFHARENLYLIPLDTSG